MALCTQSWCPIAHFSYTGEGSVDLHWNHGQVLSYFGVHVLWACLILFVLLWGQLLLNNSRILYFVCCISKQTLVAGFLHLIITFISIIASAYVSNCLRRTRCETLANGKIENSRTNSDGLWHGYFSEILGSILACNASPR